MVIFYNNVLQQLIEFRATILQTLDDMGKSKKKKQSASDEITINDFANASNSNIRTRLPKSSRKCVLVQSVEKIVLDEVDDDDDPEFKKVGKKKKRNKQNHFEEDSNAKTYPIDLWFLISEYISPEDVGRFAGICKGTNNVVNTPSFWFRLYKRYYSPNENIPAVLQPQNMTRLYLLRYNVIRALYFTYPPFIERFPNTMISRYKPTNAVDTYKSILEKTKCHSVLCQNCPTFTIEFLLQRHDSKATSLSVLRKSKKLEVLDDFSVNHEDGYMNMKITCKPTLPPNVYGLNLVGISYERDEIKLGFCAFKGTWRDANIIILSNVKRIEVHNWWSPYYPRVS